MVADNNNSMINRRKFLRNAGVATGAVAITALPAEARMTQKERLRQKDHETHNRLSREREKNDWTLQRFHKEVQKAGSEVKSSITAVEFADEDGKEINEVARAEVDSRSDEDVTPADIYNPLPKAHMSQELHVYTGENADSTSHSWTWNTNLTSGKNPWDTSLLGWTTSHYLFDGYVENPYAYPGDMHLWKRNPSGTIVRFADRTAIDEGENDTASYDINLIRQRAGEKIVYSSYYHTWNGVDIANLGFSPTGPTITYTNEEDEWHIFDQQSSHY